MYKHFKTSPLPLFISILTVMIFLLGIGGTPANAQESASEIVLSSLDEDDEPVVANWKLPQNNERKAFLIAIHGFGLQKYSYAPLARRLAAQGIETVAVDVRGFGNWSHDRHHNRVDLDRTVQDVRCLVAKLKREHPATPIFVLGESMGGAVALRLADQNASRVCPLGQPDGVIASVPGAKTYGAGRTSIKVMLHLAVLNANHIDLSHSVVDRGTARAEIAESWRNNPLNRLTVSLRELRHFRHFMKENRRIVREAAEMPILFVQREDDRLVKPVATRQLFDVTASERKEMVMVKGSEHLIFEEGEFADSDLDAVTGFMARAGVK